MFNRKIYKKFFYKIDLPLIKISFWVFSEITDAFRIKVLQFLLSYNHIHMKENKNSTKFGLILPILRESVIMN